MIHLNEPPGIVCLSPAISAFIYKQINGFFILSIMYFYRTYESSLAATNS
jgi:hypothetical protein